MNKTGKKISASDPTLWVHWGRTGGGPRFLKELTEGDIKASQGKSLISYNSHAEIAPAIRNLEAEAFPVSTYKNRMGVILGLPRLIANSFKMRRWVIQNDIQRVVCVMENVYQSIAVPLLMPKAVQYVVCIHDGNNHPGEGSLIQSIGRKIELARADSIVTFSAEVTEIILSEVSKPIITASHPPFGLEQARSDGRSFPEHLIIGLFGRLQEYKGVDLLLESAAILRKKGITNFTVRIVGDGPAAHFKNTDLGNHAEWDIRWIPESEVDGIVDSFDVMALPYTEASQSGPVALAITHAVPCVVSPAGGLSSQVEGFGTVARDLSAAAFAEALEEIVTTPQLYEALSSGAAEKAKSILSWSGLANEIRSVEIDGKFTLPLNDTTKSD